MIKISLTKTDRSFYIGALDETFIDNYYVWANDETVTRYLFQGIFPVTKDEAHKVYDIYTKSFNNVVFGIYENIKEKFRIVGVCGIHEINWVSRIGEFRILIGDQNCWNLGIGKQVLKIIVEFAFNKYNLYKMILGFNANHAAAYKAYSNTGFKQEYVVKDGFYRNGEYCDLVYMSLFRVNYQVVDTA